MWRYRAARSWPSLAAYAPRTTPPTWRSSSATPGKGLGLGRQLAALIAERAREQGITKIAGTMLAGNKAAFRLMRGFGTQMDRDVMSHGVREVVTRLAA